MKKFLSLALALVLVMLCVTPVLAANIKGMNPGDTFYVKTSGGKLNLREEPTPKANKVCKINYGEAVTILDGYQDGYVQVLYKNQSGWVDIKYLSNTKPGQSGTKPTTAPSEKVAETVSSLNFKSYKLVADGTTYIAASKPSRAGGFVNLRWVPSSDSAIIKRMYAGEEMEVISEGSKWLQVRSAEGYVGFIVKTYTSVVYRGTTEGWESQLTEQ